MKKILLILCFIGILFQVLLCYGPAATYQETQKAADSYVQKRHQSAISDSTYPIYHLRSPSGWINDPCGLFYFNSSFHVFCQSNPWGNQWGNMTWSHIASDPNQKWNFKWFYPEDQEKNFKTSAIMQSLNSGAPDKDGIFTGSVGILPFEERDNNGNKIIQYYPTAFYSAVWGIDEETQEVVCMARAMKANLTDKDGKLLDPFLTEWTKYSTTTQEDPNSHPDIIIKQPVDLNLISFRDPFLFRLPDDSNYYLLMSGGYIDDDDDGLKGVILLYKNNGENFAENWTRVNKGNNFFFTGSTSVKDPIVGGGDYECGTIHRLTDHIGTVNDTPYILVLGHDGPASEPYGKSIYYVMGNIAKNDSGIHFIPLENFKSSDNQVIQKHLDLNPDFIFYASNFLPVDNEQRKYLLGWLNIKSQADGQNTYDWAGALSIPRFLFAYKKDNEWKLGQEPVLVNALRKDPVYNSIIHLTNKKSEIFLDNVKGRHLNIDSVFEHENLIEKTFGIKIRYSEDKFIDVKINKGKLFINNNQSIKLDLPLDSSKAGLNIYLDGSVLEIFISKMLNNRLIGYQVYSAPLPDDGNLGDLNDESVILYGDDGCKSSVIVYPMDTCWTEQPDL